MNILIWLIVGLVLIFGGVVFVGAPYVPSKRREVKNAFQDLYKLGPKDTLVDVGSGDGVVLRQAAKMKASAVGYEINPFLVIISRLLTRNQTNVSTHWANFWKVELPPSTTVIYIFGDGRDISKMLDWMQENVDRIGHEIKVISYGFALPGRIQSAQLGAHRLYSLHPLKPQV